MNERINDIVDLDTYPIYDLKSPKIKKIINQSNDID